MHNHYAGATRYEMDTLFRVFVLKEPYGWSHETALIEFLDGDLKSASNWV